MVTLAQTHQIRSVEPTRLVALNRDDVVNFFSRFHDAIAEAVHAKRVRPKVQFTNPTPLTVVATA